MTVQLKSPTGDTLGEKWRGDDGTGFVRLADSYDAIEDVTKVANLIWDTGSLAWVKWDGTVTGSGGGSGTEYTVDAAAPANPVGPTLVMERDDSLSAVSEAEGDWTNARGTSKGALWVAIPDASGNPITSFGGGTQYAEDAAHVSGDTGTMALAVRTDTPANRSGADGDYEPLQVSAGRLWASATIDAALPAGANAIGKLAANSGVDIGDVDVTSVVPGVAATNLGKAEDAAHSSGDTGVMSLAVRTDTPADRSGTDGDYEPLQMSAGRLWTSATVTSSALPSGAATLAEQQTQTTSLGLIDDIVHSGDAALSKYAVIGAVLDDAATGTVTENQANSLRMSSRRALLIEGVASGTAVAVSDGSSSLTVDNAGTFAVQATVAAGATNIAKAEDDASANADVGVPAMAVRKATPANTSGTDGDYEMLQMSAGRLWTSAVLEAGSATIGAVTRAVASTATLSNVSSSATNVTLLASNANRRMAIFFNDSTQNCFLKFGATATSSSFTYKLLPGATMELPEPVYTGIIDGIWASANGAMRVTEIT